MPRYGAPFGVFPAPAPTLPVDLVAYWEMEGASGATEVDAHGANDLTDVNTVGSATGKVGNSREFTTATDNRLIRTDNTDLSIGGEISFTFAFWFNLKDTGVGGFISKYGSAGNREYLIYQSSGTLQFLASADGTAVTSVLGDPVLSASTWYFCVAYYDAVADTINVQINDGTIASQSHTGGVFDSGSTFMLGNELTVVGGTDAYLDEVGFWKRTLTSDEKTWLYNSGTGRTYAEVAAH